jgi:hypothetical protein
MGRHWKPDEELARAAESALETGPWTLAETYLQPRQQPWSDNAKAAAVLLVGACVFLAAGFFQAF